MPDRNRRSRSRRHRVRRTIRWIRALGPILLLIAAGLLSAGVVHVVELSTPVHGTERVRLQGPTTPSRSKPRDLDLESFDQELYRELQQLDSDSRGEIDFAPESSRSDLLRESLATTFLGSRYDQAVAPFRARIRATALFEGPSGAESVREPVFRPREDSRSWAPEPGTGLLVVTGLGALARRAVRPI
jgi:hypothetical protein